VELFDFLKKILHRSGKRIDANISNEFFNRFEYRFQDEDLILEALTHRSYIHVVDNAHDSSERLEFLGDSVLGLIVAENLFKSHRDFNEGDLTKSKALLVNENALAHVGEDSHLNEMILMSPDEEKSGGRLRPSIISDAVEAVIGALYLDGGIPPARNFIHKLIISRADEFFSDTDQRNFKGELLEYMQHIGQAPPHYDVVSEEGPDHDKVFNIIVKAGKDIDGFGSGMSKKEAEQRAAQQALEKLGLADKEKSENPPKD